MYLHFMNRKQVHILDIEQVRKIAGTIQLIKLSLSLGIYTKVFFYIVGGVNI